MPQVPVVSILPLLAVSIPILAAILVAVVSFYSAWWRNFIAGLATLATLIVVVSMYPAIVIEGRVITYELFQFVSPINLTFRVDGLSLIVASVSCFVWLAATIYAFSYMEHEENRGRFYVLLLLTLSGTVGVPLAGDFLSLLLFFEIMSLASYVLVVHTQTDEAYSAGSLYLFLGVIGGMSILAGLALLYFRNGTLAILPGTVIVKDFDAVIPLAAILMILGFGIKAGMAPLHIWLPRAHPVAPAPASALLSGIMIKTGAYGIIRIVNVLLVPSVDGSAASLAGQFKDFWSMMSNMGYVIIWIGIATMFLGVVLAIIQDNIKKMLACSSISQMGFILVGIGVAGYLQYDGAMGMAGASYHIINHAIFKSCLFLSAGVIAYKLGDLNMYNLGGLWKRLPFTTLVVIIASLGIVGVPFFNGYTSKTLLHHALVEAYEHHHVAALFEAERIFMIAAAGTVLYYLKFIYLTFFREPPAESKAKIDSLVSEPRSMKIGMAMLALTMMFIGLNPNFLLDKLIVPSLSSFVFDPYFIDHHITGINFFTAKDVMSSVIVFGLGGIAFAIGLKSGLFKTSIPYWMGQEFVATQMGKALVSFWNNITGVFGNILGFFGRLFSGVFRSVFRLLQGLDYKPGKSDIFTRVNLSNIDFDVLIIMGILGVVLVALFYVQFGVVGVGVW
ncbi:MAG: proton-conducting transporter membrane subunit [Bacillota bacterium]|nr:proton-conducting transporter membrane subunit [Bacillota bacterium]